MTEGRAPSRPASTTKRFRRRPCLQAVTTIPRTVCTATVHTRDPSPPPQANFVNPGVMIAGLGTELELTPKLRSFINLNYLRFAETDVIKTVLMTDDIDGEIGLDLSLGFQYRPLLTDNIIVSVGFGTLIPGEGYADIYRRNTVPVPGYGPNQTGKTDDFLYSGLFALTFTY